MSSPTPRPGAGARGGHRGRAAWRQLRALLVLVHVVAVGLAALPAPEGGMNRAAWKDPTVQDELNTWAARLRAAGLDLGDEEFQAVLWNLGTRTIAARKLVLRPLQPYYRFLGTHQSWRMFVAPHRYPARLHIDVEEGGAWRPVYVARSPEYRWRARQLDDDRMRAAIFRYAWPAYARAWRSFSAWVATRAAADFPEARRVRLRYDKRRTPSPAEVEAGVEPPGRWIRTRIIDLEPLRDHGAGSPADPGDDRPGSSR